MAVGQHSSPCRPTWQRGALGASTSSQGRPVSTLTPPALSRRGLTEATGLPSTPASRRLACLAYSMTSPLSAPDDSVGKCAECAQGGSRTSTEADGRAQPTPMNQAASTDVNIKRACPSPEARPVDLWDVAYSWVLQGFGDEVTVCSANPFASQLQ